MGEFLVNLTGAIDMVEGHIQRWKRQITLPFMPIESMLLTFEAVDVRGTFEVWQVGFNYTSRQLTVEIRGHKIAYTESQMRSLGFEKEK